MLQQQSPYSGELIIPELSFLRRIPAIVVPKQRVAMDAMVMAADMLVVSYRRLRTFAISQGSEVGVINPLLIPTLMTDCWAIVDQLHALRTLMVAADQPNAEHGPNFAQFYSLSEAATNMRNAMDHLHQKLDNLGAKKGLRNPLFGSLSYFYSDTSHALSGNCLTFHSGALMGGIKAPLSLPNGRSFVRPAGLFELSAFGQRIEFEAIFSILQALFLALGPKIEAQIRAGAETQAEETGIDLETLMESATGGFAISAHILVGDDSGPFVKDVGAPKFGLR